MNNKIKCTKCHEIKSHGDFHDSVLKEGWHCCKECRKKVAKKYYFKNKEKLILSAKNWKTENSERSTEYHKNYNKQHKERIKIYRLEYDKRPEIIKLKSDQYKKRRLSLSDKEKNKIRTRMRDKAANAAKTLSDTYIACTIFRANTKTIPNELIELKRAELLLKRAIFEINNKANEIYCNQSSKS